MFDIVLGTSRDISFSRELLLGPVGSVAGEIHRLSKVQGDSAWTIAAAAMLQRTRQEECNSTAVETQSLTKALASDFSPGSTI